MKHSKYSHILDELSKKSVFTSAEGRKAGISSRMLAYFCARGQIERISKGIYRIKEIDFDQDFEWEDLAVTAMSIPNGTICLVSALCYYDLTDEIMREYWIAVPHSNTAPQREHARIIRMRNITIGQTTVRIGRFDLKIFDRERTVIDAFRYLDQEIALKALQAYLKTTKENKPDIQKLMKYAKILRVDLMPFVKAFMI